MFEELAAAKTKFKEYNNRRKENKTKETKNKSKTKSLGKSKGKESSMNRHVVASAEKKAEDNQEKELESKTKIKEVGKERKIKKTYAKNEQEEKAGAKGKKLKSLIEEDSITRISYKDARAITVKRHAAEDLVRAAKAAQAKAVAARKAKIKESAEKVQEAYKKEKASQAFDDKLEAAKAKHKEVLGKNVVKEIKQKKVYFKEDLKLQREKRTEQDIKKCKEHNTKTAKRIQVLEDELKEGTSTNTELTKLNALNRKVAVKELEEKVDNLRASMDLPWKYHSPPLTSPKA